MSEERLSAIKVVCAAYLGLLRVPIGSIARTENQGAMALCRDYLAQQTLNEAEFIQTTFEQIADNFVSIPPVER
jgi:hypothetical protein